MATLRDYFDKDFGFTITASANMALEIHASEREDRNRIDVVGRAHYDFNAYAKFVSYYVPCCGDYIIHACTTLVRHASFPFGAPSEGLNINLPIANSFFGSIHVQHNGDSPIVLKGQFYGAKYIEAETLPFSGRIFLYCEQELSEDDLKVLEAEALQQNLSFQYRGPDFARERAGFEKPLSFISHDSRDKNEIARPLAIQLQSMLCPVWFDEFSLKVGDSLRENIEAGLKACKKCILVLSPHFLSNPGWTKVEFNSIFTREIIETQKLVLPIWHNVTRQDVFDYSPTLADRVGIQWDKGIEEMSQKLYQVIIQTM